MSEFKDEQQREALVQRLGVFELRGLAREMGIPSPTTKKRDELISMILEAFDNGVNQEVRIQKRGRPYKKLNSLDQILGAVTDEGKVEVSYENVIAFAQEEAPLMTIAGETVRLEGVCRIFGEHVTIRLLSGEGVIFVGDIYGREKLENGDIVEVTARRITESNDYQALSISLINGQSAVSYVRKEYDLGAEIISNDVFLIDDHKIACGRRNAILLDDDLYETQYLNQLKKISDQSGVKMIVLGANISFENQIMLKNLNIKYNFTTVYGTLPKINLNKTIDGLHLAENANKLGDDVLIVLTDLGALLQGLDENFERSEEHSKETEIIAKKLISLAGAYSSGKNLTLVAFYRDIDEADKFITTNLLRVFKKC